MRCIANTPSLICATHPPVTHWTTCRRTKTTAPFRRYPEFMERYMKRQTGLTQIFFGSSATKKTTVADSEERLRSILATLEQFRTVLDGSDRETALLVSVAIL